MKKILLFIILLTGHLYISAQPNCNVNYFTGNNAYSFAENLDSWWILTECKIVRINKMNNQATYYKVGLDMGECIGEGQIVANPNTNEAWVSIYKNGIYHFVNNNWQAAYTNPVYPFSSYIGIGSGLIGIDDSNKLWFYKQDTLMVFKDTGFISHDTIPSSAGTIISATIDSSANIWMTVASGGVLRYDGLTFQLYADSNSNLDNNNCSFIKYDKFDDAIWVESKRLAPGNMFSLDSPVISEFKNNTWTNYVLPHGCSGVTHDDLIADMYHDTSGVWFAAGAHTGARLIHLKDTSLFVYSPCNSNFLPAAEGIVNFICRAMNGKLYVGSNYNGLTQVDFSNWQQYMLSNSDFLGTSIHCFVSDSNANLWVGSEREYLPGSDNFYGWNTPQDIYKFNGTDWQKAVSPSVMNSQFYTNNNYAFQATTSDGKLLFFNEFDDQKIISYNIGTNTWNSFLYPDSVSSSLMGFSADHNNNLMVYARHNPSGPHSVLASWNGIAWNILNAPYFGIASANNVYFGCITNNGTDSWFLDNDTLSKYDGTSVTYYSIPQNAGHGQFAIDNVNKVWIADRYSSPFMFDGSHWYSWFNLTSQLIFPTCVYVGPDNKKYFGTTDSGLYVYNDTFWIHYNTDNTNFLNNSITCITGDKNGNIWLGTNGGVSQFHPCGGQIIYNNPVMLDVEEVKHEASKLSIYPNPASDEINIITYDNCKIEAITIIDMNSRLVLKQSDLKKKQINISNLSSGLYIMQVQTDKGNYMNKLTVTR